MLSRKGFTLVELLAVVAIIALLAGILLPVLGAARAQARLVGCAASMRGAHQALLGYAAENDRRLPPFAFSDYRDANLPLSGHWGGAGEGGDFGRPGTESVNLWTVADQDRIARRRLICPAEDGSLRGGDASYFPDTSRFSSYCLRFPPSEDLFSSAPELAYYRRGGLLQAYVVSAGGQVMPTGGYRPRVPLVRMDRTYRLAEPIGGEFDPMRNAILSDQFWRRDYSAPAGEGAYPVRAGWGHRGRFNVLFGGGAVRTLEDDGTVKANTLPPGGELPEDDLHYATYAERVWQFFDAGR